MARFLLTGRESIPKGRGRTGSHLPPHAYGSRTCRAGQCRQSTAFRNSAYFACLSIEPINSITKADVTPPTLPLHHLHPPSSLAPSPHRILAPLGSVPRGSLLWIIIFQTYTPSHPQPAPSSWPRPALH